MSVAGSLLVTLKADTESLRADLDKASRKIDQFASQAKSSGDRAAGMFDKIGLSGEKFAMSLGRITTGYFLMSGALEKAGEKGQVVAQTLGAFMAGGPIAAGVVGLSGLFKLMADDASKEASRAQASLDALGQRSKAETEKMLADWKKAHDQRMKDYESSTRDLGAMNQRLREQLFPVDDLTAARRELEKMRRDLVETRGPEVTGRRQLRPEETSRAIQLEDRIRLLEEQIRRLTPNRSGPQTYTVPGADTSYRPAPETWASLESVTREMRAKREQEEAKQTELLRKIAENTAKGTPALLSR